MNTTQRKLRAGVALHALALVGASAAVLAAAAPAYAQDYTSGAIQGTVTDENGAPVAGATVTVTSSAQGFNRSATTTASGAYRFNGLPAGSYEIVVQSQGVTGYRAEGVAIQPSQTAALNIALSSGQEIVVTGAAAQPAFTGTTRGLNVDVSEFVKTNPLGRDLTSVILLAPGTSQGDSAFGNLASIGGSSVAENAYYLNGLNITNFDNYLGSARVPFEFYRNVEVKASGYPAEFGRATGGIVNAVTKSGSNEFTAALHLNWEPNFLRSNSKDLFNCDTTGKCTSRTLRSADTVDNYSAIMEAGGPVIKDRLFVYGLAEFRRATSLTNSVNTGIGTDRRNDDPFWGAKIDAYPIDNHHLEFTIFDTRNTTVEYNNALTVTNNVPSYGIAQSVYAYKAGGVNFVGKYTGQFASWLSVSGAYGRMRDRFDQAALAGSAGLPLVSNNSGAGIVNGGTTVAPGGYFNGQTNSSTNFPYTTQREFYRADVDGFFSLLGDHHVRAGFDQENNTLEHASVRNGGAFLFSQNKITSTAYNAGYGGAGLTYQVAANGQVILNYYNSGGSFAAKNKAFYLQDEWRITDRLTLNLGVRRDDFSVNRPDGKRLVNLDKNYAPRIGATLNLWGNQSGKLYASYGSYFLPFASNTAFRQTGREVFFRERWRYSGFDGNGVPILTTQVATNVSYQVACPFKLTPTSSGQNCSVTGNGTVPDSSTAIAANLKATKENELVFGYEHKFGRWTVGLNFTHRTLVTNAEDVAIDQAVLAYCTANKIAGCEDIWTGFHQYSIVNPGKDVTINLSGLDGRQVTFKADTLGYPKAKRTYDAVDLTFNRPWDGKWSVGGSYTWSQAKGNSEGFVQSDFGQSDAGITQDFDQPSFLQGAYGYLPTDVRHRIKLWGSVALSDAFTFGTNIQVQSPRSLSCFGYNPGSAPGSTDPYSDFGNVYDQASRYCAGGQQIGVSDSGIPVYGSVFTPRGTAQKSQWQSTINLSARYNIKFGERTVTLRGDVFNLFNSQAITKRNEVGDLLGVVTATNGRVGVSKNPNYGLPTVYQAPRYVRLGIDVAF